MYVIKIGESRPNGSDEVKEIREQYAPAWGVPTDKSNEIWVNEHIFTETMNTLGLNDFFAAEDSTYPVNSITQTRFDDAYREFFRKNIDITADDFKKGFRYILGFESEEEAIRYASAAYITWFRFWVKHAVDKLSWPIISIKRAEPETY